MKTVRRVAYLLLIVLGAATVWAAFAPLHFASREEVFEIPKGTYARRAAGEKLEILPAQIRLALGTHDVLLLRNLDEVPQVFGPTVIMPGQSFRLPFEVASTYSFDCSAHVSGQMKIVVEPEPNSPWKRLRWRSLSMWNKFT